jgi:chromosome partitioning protein
MKIIAIVNQKGGVAKTTSSLNIAVGLGKKGKKVLLIDFDPQANATTGLGIDKIELEYTVYDLLKKFDYPQFRDLEFEKVVISKMGIDILPTNIKMSRIDTELGGFPGKENYLKDIVKTLPGYDYIIIDCPPSLSTLTHNALTVATDIYVPVKADYYSIEGIADLLDEVSMIKRKLNEDLKISGVFITMANTRTTLFSETREKLQKYFPDEMFNTFIRSSEDVNKSPSEGKPVIEFNPKCTSSIDYLNLVDEIVERNDK